jgi:hypothetical protein
MPMGVLGFKIVQSIMCGCGNLPWAEAMTVLCGDMKGTDLESIVGNMVFGYSTAHELRRELLEFLPFHCRIRSSTILAFIPYVVSTSQSYSPMTRTISCTLLTSR